MNYTELCSAVQSTIEHTFTPEQLRVFCEQTEQRVYGAVQLPALRRNMLGAISQGNRFLPLPADFLYPHSLSVVVAGRHEFLVHKDTNYVQEAFPSITMTGVPRVYAMFDAGTLLLGPTPAQGYEAHLTFGYYPPSIATAGTSWLGDNFDTVLLNGMLVEAGRFLRLEADAIGLYTKLFDEGMMLLRRLGDGKLRQDSYRAGQARVPVT